MINYLAKAHCIKDQEEHHKHKTFQQGYDEFIRKCGFKKFNG